ncbi:MAG: hypothetical protein JO142_11955 [Burkholderiales bacterium]|nr:hypothetical protein [Burkholderiales bacterium]
MSNTQTSNDRGTAELDQAVSRGSAGKASPATREQPSARMAKRGDVRRRLEDLMLAKETQDLW